MELRQKRLDKEGQPNRRHRAFHPPRRPTLPALFSGLPAAAFVATIDDRQWSMVSGRFACHVAISPPLLAPRSPFLRFSGSPFLLSPRLTAMLSGPSRVTSRGALRMSTWTTTITLGHPGPEPGRGSANVKRETVNGSLFPLDTHRRSAGYSTPTQGGRKPRTLAARGRAGQPRFGRRARG